MWNDAHDAYLESRVLSADPLELVNLLYQASIAKVREARRCLADGDIAGRSRAITRAVEILAELAGSLDQAAGGEIAARLAALYDYLQRRLLEANLHQIDEPLAESLGLLATLSEAWETVGRERQPAPPAANVWTAQPDGAAVSHAWSF